MSNTDWLNEHTANLRALADDVIETLEARTQAATRHTQAVDNLAEALAALEEAIVSANLLSITRAGYTIGFLSPDDDDISIEPLDHADL